MKSYYGENYASEICDNYHTTFYNTSPAPQYYQENPIFNLVIHNLYHLPNCILKPFWTEEYKLGIGSFFGPNIS